MKEMRRVDDEIREFHETTTAAPRKTSINNCIFILPMNLGPIKSFASFITVEANAKLNPETKRYI